MSKARDLANFGDDISDGVISAALDGDGSALTNLPSSAPTTADVLSATAGASAGAVGTYAYCHRNTYADITFGTTYAGSDLIQSGVQVLPLFTSTGSYVGTGSGGSLSGTWRAMGQETYLRNTSYRASTIFLRIS